MCGEKGHLSFQCKNRENKSVECFKCKKKGHISKYCREEKTINNVERHKNNDIDERIISLDGLQRKAIFDTGASVNMLCSGVLKDLPNVKIIPNKKTYHCFNGSVNNTVEL
jgi:hypothetical protein